MAKAPKGVTAPLDISRVRVTIRLPSWMKDELEGLAAEHIDQYGDAAPRSFNREAEEGLRLYLYARGVGLETRRARVALRKAAEDAKP